MLAAAVEATSDRSAGTAPAQLPSPGEPTPGPPEDAPRAPASSAFDARQLFISTAIPGTRQWWWAAGLVLLLTLGFAATVPHAAAQLARQPAFIPVYETALVVLDLVTAVLLYGLSIVRRSLAVLVLAAGYLFSAGMTAVHGLSFPGVFSSTGLPGGGPQTTAWLYMFWHAGFPLAVIAYARLKRRDHELLPVAPSVAFALSAAVTLGIVVAATLLATAGAGWLPAVMSGDHYSSTMIFVVMIVWLMSPFAIAVLALIRPVCVLDLWLMTVLAAWTFAIALSAVFNAGRYDLGFYAGRSYGFLATSLLLVGLLLETTRLYGRSAAEAARLTGRLGRLEASAQAQSTQLEHSNAALGAEIAEHRRTEARLVQVQKMEAIGNLTGGMAHDFNNLLGVVIGNLDLLRERCADDPDTHELVGEALEAGLRGADLTRRLLAFARRQPLQPERVEPNELVSGIVTLLRRVLGEDIAIALDLGDGVWPIVADPAQLEASITNLANNARDAMPHGGRLTFVTGNRQLDADYASMHEDLAPGDYVMIEISDTGSGIPPEVLARIFEPFFTTKQQGKGTGLGLSMVFGFMKQSGGHINVYSEPGIGTTFRLYLPRAEQPVHDRAVTGAEPMPRGHGQAVLIVEDNLALRRVAQRQLRDLGYRVFEAENAAAALALLAREPIDLLFSDIVLPGGIDGIEMVRQARQRWPQLRAVLTSGFPGDPGEKPGFDGRLLAKPYLKTELARAISAALAE